MLRHLFQFKGVRLEQPHFRQKHDPDIAVDMKSDIGTAQNAPDNP